MFDPFLDRWKLTRDGDPIRTFSSDLLPVLFEGRPAMLKVARFEEEVRGGRLLAWWQGRGAAPVLALHGDALLLERANDDGRLTRLAHEDDDEATRILCDTAARLHEPRNDHPPALTPLREWFRSLWRAGERYGGTYRAALEAAERLIAEPRDVRPLHGDLHHGNVLSFGERGWLAIDPKGLIGERSFDYANIFYNPVPLLATNPERFRRRVDVVSERAGLERERLVQWILAYGGLSSAWHLEDGDERGARLALIVAELARQNSSSSKR
ncbi:aminoglycoside phosphotransferase family protein [Deinococcus yavapaiensis]|uniref:Streptomycin 6-kinase n=1 Tax=Deinococcus yavapaiensis KR-236 TaxID=694435 RepID=A0A318S1X4_9DEIO|nr:aminoglycoside phosphotransferase family protein [Deinococcus yavapaiensis]PYE48937.1 streptomycin 6-kinase [Deinococcus yavapaiensis KR-236]